MNWYKSAFSPQWRKREPDPLGYDNLYRKKKPEHGEGLDLNRPFDISDSIGGPDESLEAHPPRPFSNYEERGKIQPWPDEHDGGENPIPMSDSKSKFNENTVLGDDYTLYNSDINLDRKIGIHNMGSNVFTETKSRLRGI